MIAEMDEDQLAALLKEAKQNKNSEPQYENPRDVYEEDYGAEEQYQMQEAL